MSKQERVVFFNGQRLTAGDLTAAQEVNRDMRWLHNSSLHNWGIGFGLAPTGEKGAREVTIAPGYALDAMGREIVLAEFQTLPVPPLAGANGQPATHDLTIAYPSDDDVEVVETRAGICLPRDAVRLSEAPTIRWLETAQVRHGLDIVLARARILNCQLDEPLSTTQRRSARPAAQPYIASGRTPKGQTLWSFWPDPDNPVDAWGVETPVDTSIARFRLTPRYVARVAGKRSLTAAQFAYNVLGARKAATIRDDSDDARQLQQMFANAFRALGGTITTQEEVSAGDTDMSGVLTAIAADSPDVLHFPVSDPGLASLIAEQSAEVNGLEDTTLMGKEWAIVLVEGFARVEDATPNSFILRVLLPRGLSADDFDINPEIVFVGDGAESLFETSFNWHVVWMGVEG